MSQPNSSFSKRPSPLLLALALGTMFNTSCDNAASSTLQSNRKTTQNIELGLNDVAIMMPYEAHPEMIAKAPTAAAFVPAFAMQEIKKILIDDQKIHNDEQNAFGKLGDLSLEADIADLGAEAGPTPFRMVSIRIDPCGNSIGRLTSSTLR